MQNHIELFLKQLSELPPSGYKTQLEKYGEAVLRNIISNSIISLIAEIRITENTPAFKLHEADINIKTNKYIPIKIKLPCDLEVLNELVYKQVPRMDKINEASNKVSAIINNNFMNYILSDINITVNLSKKAVFEKRENTRVIIIGNDVLDLNYPIQPTIDNTSLRFIGDTLEGDLLFHSSRIPSRDIYTVDLVEEKPLIYHIKDSLTIFNNEFIHVAGLELINPELLRKYTIK